MPNKEKNFEELLAEVICFIDSETGPWKKKIAAYTDLRNDLRMHPEDAFDLMVKFFKIFGISEGDCNWARYYELEYTMLMAFFHFLFVRPRRKPVKLVRLTVGMLAGAARDGVWRTEVLEHEFGENL